MILTKPKKSRDKAVIFLLALAVSMSLYTVPVAALAAEVAPPVVEAEIMGSLLKIHAASGFYEVEAVYVNDRRFNHRVDSALVIDISGYITEGEAITVHAVDFAGNHSNTVLLTPPPPALPPAPNNITPDGQGEVLDHLTSDDEIEVITVSTPSGNVFYLIIDHTRSDNNVYFLNAVTEWDLLAMATEAELAIPIQLVELPELCEEPAVVERDPPDTVEPEPTLPAVDDDGGGGKFGLFIVLAIAGAGAFGVIYYLKVFKPKKEREMYSDSDDDEYEDIGEDEIIEIPEETGDLTDADDVDSEKYVEEDEADE